MKRIFIISLILLPYLLTAQSPIKQKKYPSLLWEITGNGLTKPSYLFGTMHVSSKLAFHLADSFYIGIRNADVVALETNPESWQEDMSNYDFESGYRFNSYLDMPDDYLSINSLKFGKYDKRIERMLYSNPSTINNLLYRTYGNDLSDFEEDTYLDLYIFQCGKKWGKKVAGVEKYGESMRLMIEAYRDAAKDKNKKERSYDTDNNFSNRKLQEAYRSGNLDWLDSINRYNSYSSAFDEKFLYRRNEIQAESIDSILKNGSTLFVGVGAAHLPGNRGVIEILRKKGYKLRPVKMGERDSQHKNQVEKLRVPVIFHTQMADDGAYKVDIPGKFYEFGNEPGLKQSQYADMANGSYYMVTRILTNAWMWGHSSARVQRIVDSLLYENIPGKIITKTSVIKNGYKGIELTNKTRRGDIQRYNIFVTPFEVIVFKMSGTGDYVMEGEEAKKFFASIQLKEYKGEAPGANWKTYSPSYGGFSAELPHDPFVGNNGNWVYDAEDKATNTQYRIIRTDIHNYHFAEEDTFDLGLMDESFASSEFIDKQVSRKQTTHRGYPALDCSYKDKSGGLYMARFIIQGPHYYTLLTHGNKETKQMTTFLNSFEIKPFVYGKIREQTDSSLYFSVRTPVFPGDGKEKLNIPQEDLYSGNDDDSEESRLANGIYRGKVIVNDTTGEKIFVSFFKSPLYTYVEDSSVLEKQDRFSIFGDTTWITRYKNSYEMPGKMKVWETIVTDTGSSRTLWSKTFYKDGIGFSLLTQSDTLTQPSAFLRSFFDSFTPSDTLQGMNLFTKKTGLFFKDFMSSDSTVHQRAVKAINRVQMDSTDLPQLQKAIGFINWNEQKYIDTKKSLISKLDDINTKAASDYLKKLYYAAGDTVELQYSVLEALLRQQTKYAYSLFRDIITNEPPVIDLGGNNISRWSNYYPSLRNITYSVGSFDDYSNGNFMDELFDSLKLSRTILPDLLPLLNLDDYKSTLMSLVGQMADSNLVVAKDYESYFNKFLLEAKQELKKQSITEKKKAIERAEQKKDDDQHSTMPYVSYNLNNEEADSGNEDLILYARLLLPFWDSKPNVKPVIEQMLASGDKRLKYNTMMLLIRNNKPYPDSLLQYFAKMDDYRYELYTDLKFLDKQNIFPGRYNNHLDLAKSNLLISKSYEKPDSIVFIQKLPAEVKNKKGFVYFFKYKNKKDDTDWKLATAGLLPEDSTVFEFDDIKTVASMDLGFSAPGFSNYAYDFTEFRNTKLKEEGESVATQLGMELKKMMYSKRRSGREFYQKDNAISYEFAAVDGYSGDDESVINHEEIRKP